MTKRNLRKAAIAIGYVGLLAMVVGAWLVFLNHHNPIMEFDVTEKSGIAVLCIGFGVLVISALLVRFPLQVEPQDDYDDTNDNVERK
jgi:hydrogenase/urease accessory protein HupE